MRKNLKNKLVGLIRDSIAAVFYAFRQATKVFFPGRVENAANLDPFYIGGAVGLFSSIKRNRRRLLVIIPIVLYAVLQLIVLHDIDILRLVVNIAKIILCIFTMFYVKDNWSKYSVYRIVKIATVLIFIVTVVALFLQKNKVLWRLNDIVNVYDMRRLHGLFLEPSELGFHAIILVICLVAFLLSSKQGKRRLEMLLLMAMNIATIALAKPFGAIIIGMVAIFVLITVKVFHKVTKKKVLAYTTTAAIIVVGIVFAFVTKNPIAMRAIDTINGNDASNYYRVEVSWNVMAESFADTTGVGVGFGNLNTSDFKQDYKHLGLSTVVANSFQYFIIEAGVFAIFVLIALWSWIFKKVERRPTALKIALLVFLFLYQIFGGHFTSGLTWALYGLCVSEFDEHKEMERLEAASRKVEVEEK